MNTRPHLFSSATMNWTLIPGLVLMLVFFLSSCVSNTNLPKDKNQPKVTKGTTEAAQVLDWSLAPNARISGQGYGAFHVDRDSPYKRDSKSYQEWLNDFPHAGIQARWRPIAKADYYSTFAEITDSGIGPDGTSFLSSVKGSGFNWQVKPEMIVTQRDDQADSAPPTIEMWEQATNAPTWLPQDQRPTSQEWRLVDIFEKTLVTRFLFLSSADAIEQKVRVNLWGFAGLGYALRGSGPRDGRFERIDTEENVRLAFGPELTVANPSHINTIVLVFRNPDGEDTQAVVLRFITEFYAEHQPSISNSSPELRYHWGGVKFLSSSETTEKLLSLRTVTTPRGTTRIADEESTRILDRVAKMGGYVGAKDLRPMWADGRYRKPPFVFEANGTFKDSYYRSDDIRPHWQALRATAEIDR